MGETAETLRIWRGLYKAAMFETDTSITHRRSPESSRLSMPRAI
jgi:hypothetical protein